MPGQIFLFYFILTNENTQKLQVQKVFVFFLYIYAISCV